MVRADGGGPLMKIIDTDRGEARCIWFDQRGAVHVRRFDMDRLNPFWLSTGPKSLWPDITQIDLIAIEKEEREAAESRKAGRKAARKQRRSNKTKRRADATA
jgi:uncharacterized protein YodC (DUF2158 family)